MNTFINNWNANEAGELSTDELSAVSGGHNGPTWGQLANAAMAVTTTASSVVTGGGVIATYATIGMIEVAKQTRE